jgi:hypothetical protein
VGCLLFLSFACVGDPSSRRRESEAYFSYTTHTEKKAHCKKKHFFVKKEEGTIPEFHQSSLVSKISLSVNILFSVCVYSAHIAHHAHGLTKNKHKPLFDISIHYH